MTKLKFEIETFKQGDRDCARLVQYEGDETTMGTAWSVYDIIEGPTRYVATQILRRLLRDNMLRIARRQVKK